MADAHHDAAHHHERRSGKTKFLGAQQRGHRHVTAGFHLAVSFNINAAAEIMFSTSVLVRFGQPEFPGTAGVLDGGQRRRACAAIVAGNQHHIGVRLGDAGGDRSDADLGDQLDADTRIAVGIFQVMDQFREILDGINVMVRRRRNQADARGGAAGFGDGRIDLFAGQFAAFARFRALGHFDLQLPGIDKVMARHAETSTGHLLDRRIFRIAVRFQNVACRIFAAFAGVALAPEAVHGNGEGFVRLLGNGTIAHCAGLETFDEAFDGFHLVEGNWRFRKIEVQQSAQGAEVFRLVVHQFGVFAVNLFAAQPAGGLQFVDRLWIEQVIFTTVAPLILGRRLRARDWTASRGKAV